jgi:hypothetical protein
MRTFKFLRNNLFADWKITGLLDMCENEELMIRALDNARDYIFECELQDDDTAHFIFPLMAKLFRDKHMEYSDNDIRELVVDVLVYFRGPALERHMDELRTTAWMGIDYEAEMVHYTADKFNWNEAL